MLPGNKYKKRSGTSIALGSNRPSLHRNSQQIGKRGNRQLPSKTSTIHSLLGDSASNDQQLFNPFAFVTKASGIDKLAPPPPLLSEELRGLYVHQIIERNLYKKNEPPRLPRGAKSVHGNFSSEMKVTAPRHMDDGDKQTQPTSTTTDHETVLNPMLRRLGKKKRKKVKEDEGPVDARRKEERILLELAPHQQLEYMSKNSHFTIQEVKDLETMFKHMTDIYGTPGEMNRALFRVFFIQVLGLTDAVMLDQIFNYFDAGGEGTISGTEFLLNLSIIIRGTLEEHIKFCYFVYDLNGDGGIGRAEVMSLIRLTLDAPLDDDDDLNESIRDMATMIMNQLDPEGTGQIAIKNFREAVLRDPLTLQLLGPCLPEERHIRALLALVTWDYKDFATNYSLPYYPAYPYEKLRYTSSNDPEAETLRRQASIHFIKTTGKQNRGIKGSTTGFKK